MYVWCLTQNQCDRFKLEDDNMVNLRSLNPYIQVVYVVKPKQRYLNIVLLDLVYFTT